MNIRLVSRKKSMILSATFVLIFVVTLGIYSYILSYSAIEVRWNELISKRLERAEANWLRSNKRRSAADDKGYLSERVVENGLTIWDFFYPSFDCPYTEERIGRTGDGGKWVCGFEELAKKTSCIVYSFGVGGDTSFEEEILERTDCLVRMYDPTVSAPLLTQRYSNRTVFEPYGILGMKPENTLRRFLERNGDTVIDILKIDIEGYEWETLAQIAMDFSNVLPFAQLEVEIHMNRIPEDVRVQALRRLWEILEGAGLRLFHTELNLVSLELYMFSEFSFVNINLDPFKIKLV